MLRYNVLCDLSMFVTDGPIDKSSVQYLVQRASSSHIALHKFLHCIGMRVCVYVCVGGVCGCTCVLESSAVTPEVPSILHVHCTM